jgi:hypothetical protein
VQVAPSCTNCLVYFCYKPECLGDACGRVGIVYACVTCTIVFGTERDVGSRSRQKPSSGSCCGSVSLFSWNSHELRGCSTLRNTITAEQFPRSSEWMPWQFQNRSIYLRVFNARTTWWLLTSRSDDLSVLFVVTW